MTISLASMVAIQQNLFSKDLADSEQAPVDYWPSFLSPKEAKQLLQCSLQLEWQQHQMKILGRVTNLPRLEMFVGDSQDFEYLYSGQVSLKAQPWPTWLKEIRDRIEMTTGYSYRVAVGNYYRDGQDSIGYHSDDEPHLGPEAAIASLSLGATRRFLIKPKTRSGVKAKSYDLTHGSLLLMGPGCQEKWVHAVPKTQRNVSVRINWTFRPHINQSPKGKSIP